jgi:hypothetical protein
VTDAECSRGLFGMPPHLFPTARTAPPARNGDSAQPLGRPQHPRIHLPPLGRSCTGPQLTGRWKLLYVGLLGLVGDCTTIVRDRSYVADGPKPPPSSYFFLSRHSSLVSRAILCPSSHLARFFFHPSNPARAAAFIACRLFCRSVFQRRRRTARTAASLRCDGPGRVRGSGRVWARRGRAATSGRCGWTERPGCAGRGEGAAR